MRWFLKVGFLYYCFVCRHAQECTLGVPKWTLVWFLLCRFWDYEFACYKSWTFKSVMVQSLYSGHYVYYEQVKSATYVHAHSTVRHICLHLIKQHPHSIVLQIWIILAIIMTLWLLNFHTVVHLLCAKRLVFDNRKIILYIHRACNVHAVCLQTPYVLHLVTVRSLHWISQMQVGLVPPPPPKINSVMSKNHIISIVTSPHYCMYRSSTQLHFICKFW